MNHPRPIGSGLLAGLVLAVTLTWLAAPAGASGIAPTKRDDRATCNMAIWDDNGTSTVDQMHHGYLAARCYYDGRGVYSDGNLYTIDPDTQPLQYINLCFVNADDNSSLGCIGPPTYSGSPVVTDVFRPAAGAIQFRMEWQRTGSSDATFPDVLGDLTHGIISPGGPEISSSGMRFGSGTALYEPFRSCTLVPSSTLESATCAPQPRIAATFQQQSGRPAMPSWPADYYTNTGGGAITDNVGTIPKISCGRTLQDMGNGQWFAHAQGVVLNPRVGAVDTPIGWYTSWGDGPYTGASAVIPLPPAGSPAWDHPEDLSISYRLRREVPTAAGYYSYEWDNPLLTAYSNGDIGQLNTLGAALVAGFGELIGIYKPEFLYPQLYEGYIFDGGEAELPHDQTWSSVDAFCQIPVNPQTDAEDPDVIITSPPPDPHDPGGDDIDPPPDPGSETTDNACGGGSWWNPITWAKSVFCGLADGFGSLLGALGDLLDFITNIPGWLIGDVDFDGITADWSSKFPFSVGTEATGAVTQLASAMTDGVNGTACGPTIDPGLEQVLGDEPLLAGNDLSTVRAQIPAPAEANCPGDTDQTQEIADLMGWRKPIRAVETLLLVYFFLRRIARSIGPRDPAGASA